MTQEKNLDIKNNFSWRSYLTIVFACLLLSCQASNPPKLSSGHIKIKPVKNKRVPAPVVYAPSVPRPKLEDKLETYTVVVNDVAVKDLLYTLSRDAKLNVDIHPKVTGKVTLNAYKQTLAKILYRISKQVDLRYQLKNKALIISPDTPFWRNYRVDYVNMSRKSTSEVSVATRIATTGASSTSASDGNNSKTKVTNVSNNDFWKTMVSNLRTIVGEVSTLNSNSVSKIIANPTSSIINVNATQKQHSAVQTFIQKVMSNAQRQVLIEMTIVEVELSDRFQAGIDWQRLSSNTGVGSNGISIKSTLIGSNLVAAPVFSLGYNQTKADGSNISSTLKLLENFGDVKVLSSPKLLTLNNQAALLKVVDEQVYFTLDAEVSTETVGANTTTSTTFTSQVHTVPIGLVMSVIPQINQDGYVTLNVRPTITRITSYVDDPAIKLNNPTTTAVSRIPQIQIRELESLLQVANGQTIVMGGLMQNTIDKKTNSIPGLKRFKRLNKLLSHRDHTFKKTELVIFLKPTIINDARMDAKFNSLKRYLPGSVNSVFKNYPPATGK